MFLCCHILPGSGKLCHERGSSSCCDCYYTGRPMYKKFVYVMPFDVTLADELIAENGNVEFV